jgi:murein DD-endopeptidase MepM/ murein hydrolase activator NlpD
MSDCFAVVQARRRIPLAAVLVLAAVLALVATTSSAQSPARARAEAAIADGALGRIGHVVANGSQDRSRESETTRSGLAIDSGEAAASSTTASGQGEAQASAVARSINLFDGLVTAYGVRRTATAHDDDVRYDGKVEGLKIAGRLIGDKESERDYDGDGVHVTINSEGTGLEATLTRARGRWPAGATVVIADVDADAADGTDPAATPTPTPTATPTPDPAQEKASKAAAKAKRKADAVKGRLSSRRIVFPVYGDARVADDFGGPREIGPHQGNDVFAPFGSPVLAVADGTLNRVGTLPISGNRLWLKTKSGDSFFYAHLSAFSSDAVNGRKVKAGTVLGFVGNTGDAEPTPPHLHFEIHPNDKDAVDPHAYLVGWQENGHAPGGAWLSRYGSDTAARPGALVEVRDFITGS